MLHSAQQLCYDLCAVFIVRPNTTCLRLARAGPAQRQFRCQMQNDFTSSLLFIILFTQYSCILQQNMYTQYSLQLELCLSIGCYITFEYEKANYYSLYNRHLDVFLVDVFQCLVLCKFHFNKGPHSTKIKDNAHTVFECKGKRDQTLTSTK